MLVGVAKRTDDKTSIIEINIQERPDSKHIPSLIIYCDRCIGAISDFGIRIDENIARRDRVTRIECTAGVSSTVAKPTGYIDQRISDVIVRALIAV